MRINKWIQIEHNEVKKKDKNMGVQFSHSHNGVRVETDTH
jgi:hypothetical protein